MHQARPTHSWERPSVSEILPELLIGEYPRGDDILWLKETYGITAVHSLQDDEDMRVKGLDPEAIREQCEAHGIRFARTPIQDGSSEAMRGRLGAALEDLHALVAAGGRVYLHCNGGLNRAPTLAIAYLHAYRGMPLEEALAHVKERRSCGPFMIILEDYFAPRDAKPPK
jgi:serine/threonine/tyrosine-interacting protein